MIELLQKIMPHVVEKYPELIKCTIQTLQMVFQSGSISFCIGLVFGIILTVTRKNDILENAFIYQLFDKVINIFRSIPFVILLAALIPLTRAVVGTAIGTKGAMIPLVFGTVPFFSRQIEAALAQLDRGLIEAGRSMGNSPWEIIFRIYLKESIPHIARATTITFISLIGLTAMAGSIGGGGLGDFAIRYGYQRNQTDITYVTVIILLIFVFALQALGNLLTKKTTH